jgi:hypothetical protein
LIRVKHGVIATPGTKNPRNQKQREIAAPLIGPERGRLRGELMSIKLLRHELLGVVLYVLGTDYINSANAQQTDQQTIVTKAEAALAAKIKCRDFKKNADGTWTSGPNTKIGVNAFPQHTFDIHGVSIGGADLGTVLNRKCGVTPPVR